MLEIGKLVGEAMVGGSISSVFSFLFNTLLVVVVVVVKA